MKGDKVGEWLERLIGFGFFVKYIRSGFEKVVLMRIKNSNFY